MLNRLNILRSNPGFLKVGQVAPFGTITDTQGSRAAKAQNWGLSSKRATEGHDFII